MALASFTMALDNTVAIANGKGGVGKTTVTAHLAGTAALSGWRVLAVDLDPQGNLGSDLGYDRSDGDDHGQALLDAARHGRALQPLCQVRDNLDVLAGGEATEALEGLLHADVGAAMLEGALAQVAGDYNLVVIDCPPSSGALVEAALSAARFLVIPTRGDSASLDGLARLARRFAGVRATSNPDLELLGVVLFDFGAKDQSVARTRERLQADLDGAAPVFSTFIRNNRVAPSHMRDLGLLAHEYEAEAAKAPRWYQDRSARRYSRAAGGLASDYQSLTEEILAAFAARRRAAAVTGP